MRRRVKLVIAALAAFGVYALAGGRRRNEPGRSNGRAALPGRHATRERWDEVDEASYESFPASDPPSYSGGKL